VPPLVPVSALWAATFARQNGIGLFNQIDAPWLAIAGTLLVRSLASYVNHVLMHKVPLLWRLHRVHHADTHLDVSTTARFHPLEFGPGLFIMLPAVMAFGLSPWVLIVYEILDAVVNLCSHANLRLPERLDRALRWIFVTPNMHSIHHSSWQPETDSNYGAVFTLWDRLFGTYSERPAGGFEAMRIGLEEIPDERASSFLWQLKSPLLADVGEIEKEAASNVPVSS
jgi:sterol desaturase/sphingolipid hydroxylase (fatty acid hydroxylase superfamily)